MKKIPAAQFKSHCLAVMDQGTESGRPVIVTKHGKPMVQIIPAEPGQEEIFGFLQGKGRIVGDIEKTIPVSDWHLPEIILLDTHIVVWLAFAPDKEMRRHGAYFPRFLFVVILRSRRRWREWWYPVSRTRHAAWQSPRSSTHSASRVSIWCER